MRLIDADALGVGRCNPDVMLNRAHAEGWNGVINIINNAPTIDPIHAAGGCYCRECKLWRRHTQTNEKYGRCVHYKITHEDDFCNWGKPREAQDDG